MLIKHLLFLLWLYLLAITSSEGWRPYVVEFTNISTYSSVNYIEMNSSMSTNGAISIHMNFLRDVSDIHAKAVITIETTSGKMDLEFINRTLVVCEFFRNKKYEPILQVLYKALTKSGKFPTACPIRNVYFIKDVVINSEDLPPIMISSRGVVEIIIMTKNANKYKPIAGITIHYQLRQINNKSNSPILGVGNKEKNVKK